MLHAGSLIYALNITTSYGSIVKLYLFFYLTLLLALTANAEIRLADTQHILLPNNNEYAITQDLGNTAGSNLFHAFASFNLTQHQTAIFSGTEHIENVVVRVTGGLVSHIDGTIKNTIQGANTWLMNSAGIVFGQHAKLDVQGGFYASSADYLRFTDGQRVYSDNQKNSSFSAAPIAEFGFIDNKQGSIIFHAGHVQTQGLLVSNDQSLFLSGGNIQLENKLSAGKIVIHAQNLTLSNGAKLQANGENALIDISVRAHLQIDNASLETNNTQGNAGTIQLNSLNLSLRNNAQIKTHSTHAGGGQIIIENEGLTYLENASINTHVQEGKNGSGDIELNTDFLVQNYAPISAQAADDEGGNINIETNGIYQFPPYNGSLITASAQLGTSAALSIEIEEGLSSGEFTLPGQFIDNAKLAANECAAIIELSELNRFKMDTSSHGQSRSLEWFH